MQAVQAVQAAPAVQAVQAVRAAQAVKASRVVGPGVAASEPKAMDAANFSGQALQQPGAQGCGETSSMVPTRQGAGLGEGEQGGDKQSAGQCGGGQARGTQGKSATVVPKLELLPIAPRGTPRKRKQQQLDVVDLCTPSPAAVMKVRTELGEVSGGLGRVGEGWWFPC